MKDLILQENDILISSGDFSIEKSFDQHIDLIFTANKGEFKETPEIGFGAVNYIKTNVSKKEFARNLNVELKRDNIDNVTVTINNEGLLIIE